MTKTTVAGRPTTAWLCGTFATDLPLGFAYFIATATVLGQPKSGERTLLQSNVADDSFPYAETRANTLRTEVKAECRKLQIKGFFSFA